MLASGHCRFDAFLSIKGPVSPGDERLELSRGKQSARREDEGVRLNLAAHPSSLFRRSQKLSGVRTASNYSSSLDASSCRNRWPPQRRMRRTECARIGESGVGVEVGGGEG